MSGTICVLGATGTQGGSVCQVLLKNNKWKVRGVTRSPNSDAAKRLSAKVCDIATQTLIAQETDLLRYREWKW